ncbi:MAG: 4Fe-4S dicluster domain-containing protein [Pseudomonadota bacterium]
MKIQKNLNLNFKDLKITELPECDEVNLLLGTCSYDEACTKFKALQSLETGEELFPGFISTVTGEIKSVEKMTGITGELSVLKVHVNSEDKVHSSFKEHENISSKTRDELLSIINKSGFNFSTESNINTIFIYAIDLEPLCSVNSQIFTESQDKLTEALTFIKKLYQANEIVLIVPKVLEDKTKQKVLTNAKVIGLDGLYLKADPAMIISSFSDAASRSSHAFITFEKVLAAYNSVIKGQPYIYKVISLITKNEKKNLKVRIGTPISKLLENTELKDNDKVILGGPMKGHTCYDLNYPVNSDIDMIYVQDAKDVYKYESNQCINCGKCVNACPVNLHVNLIGRFAEFSNFETCDELGVNDCIECAYCSYKCPAKRSLLQLMQHAKRQIALNTNTEI